MYFMTTTQHVEQQVCRDLIAAQFDRHRAHTVAMQYCAHVLIYQVEGRMAWTFLSKEPRSSIGQVHGTFFQVCQ